ATLIASSERLKSALGWNPQRTDLHTIVSDAWEFTRQLGDRAHSAKRVK
ncbi:MAG: UDP-glucose 4-epimerase GalE, partial [Corynebacterium casei]|nr:UDP-glucose 4-epimerase GalE [Corynebacterium casei]